MNEFEIMVSAGLNVGATPMGIEEGSYQSVAYIGMEDLKDCLVKKWGPKAGRKWGPA